MSTIRFVVKFSDSNRTGDFSIISTHLSSKQTQLCSVQARCDPVCEEEWLYFYSIVEEVEC